MIPASPSARRAALSLLILATSAAAAHAQDSTAARVDRVFARWTNATPGCALGVAKDGRTVYEKGYGMANLELDVPNAPAMVFETGSVAKQFTAAAIVLLAQQGKLSLDDEIHKHLPELPDYGAPVTLRQMLHHTSGLRDWITLLAVAGRPWDTRFYTNADIVDLMSRQRSLNFAPGSEYLYSNSGYTLLAEIVARVSAQPFASFVAANIFKPLGMTHTQYRDDYTRVVKGRSTAYALGRDGAWHANMLFSNVHGSGGILTTVGDLLLWNENFANPKVGGRALVDTMQTKGRLTDGREIDYALGLIVSSYQGVPEVSHTGSTAGYRTFLGRWPEQHLSIALLCNAASANTTALAHGVADVFLAGQTRPVARRQAPAGITLPAQALASRAGLYRNDRTKELLRLVVQDGKLRIARGAGIELTPVAPDRFVATTGVAELVFSAPGPDGPPSVRYIGASGDTTLYVATREASLTPALLAEYAGTYRNEELDAAYTIVVKDGNLVLRGGVAREVRLTPTYASAFDAEGLDHIQFTRDEAGKVDGFDVFAGRARSIHFTKR